ncbi:hypothetical protein HZP52_07740 [Elizabethkingia anophelis]|uniref:hypothetical protein n=1 Tax=Elizabethkingia anophelis TaxID=1117645 RepID=UPI0021A7A612|nr:hypothetical protein [Elizabethkingia anophelis]MCT4193879.1 hypothetical protein [Elizabethkingia anophelis]
MNKLYLLFIILGSLLKAQSKMETPFFIFSCNCSLVKESYNTNNKSYNYSYQDKDGKSIYMISVKNTTIGDKGFLDSIKYSGAFNYKNVKFRGVNAIIAEIYQGGQYGIHLGFFSSKKGYSIILASPDENRTTKMYIEFNQTFNYK